MWSCRMGSQSRVPVSPRVGKVRAGNRTAGAFSA